jgi:hypothetical protein
MSLHVGHDILVELLRASAGELALDTANGNHQLIHAATQLSWTCDAHS